MYRTKRRFVEGNLERALSEGPRPGAERKLTGKEEALLVATVCSNPPAGRARWTLDLLADEMVQLAAHESLSRETVRRAAWPIAISSRGAGRDVVHPAGRRRLRRPHGRCARSLCRGAGPEATGGLLRREPDPAHRRGAPSDPARARADRAPTIANTGATAPPWRCSSSSTPNRPWPQGRKVTGRRTAQDFAVCSLRELADLHYPKAERIRVVLDNPVDPFGRRSLSDLPRRARGTAISVDAALSSSFVPKHASWLNMVEIEIGVLA